MSTVVQLSTSNQNASAPKGGPLKDLYEIGEIPPLGLVPQKI
jgi:hypothetical protein